MLAIIIMLEFRERVVAGMNIVYMLQCTERLLTVRCVDPQSWVYARFWYGSGAINKDKKGKIAKPYIIILFQLKPFLVFLFNMYTVSFVNKKHIKLNGVKRNISSNVPRIQVIFFFLFYLYRHCLIKICW
jgi:hypothetical protein